MTHLQILTTVALYVAMLYVVAWRAATGATVRSFFTGGRQMQWGIVALGMIGAPMSGVSFVSVPGSVATDCFSYMQMVVGFTVGQIIIALWLVPMFYRSGVTSLYEWLDSRFGVTTHRSGAAIFLGTKLLLTAIKLFVVVWILQGLVFDDMGIPLWLNALITVTAVWGFTLRSGVRSVVWSDVLQTLLLIGSVVCTILVIFNRMDWNISTFFSDIKSSPMSQIVFDFGKESSRSFWQMFFGGVFVLTAMTGLDQDMMQRNLSCRNIRSSQLNILLTAIAQAVVILLLLTMGWMLYAYGSRFGLELPADGDSVFATIALSPSMPKIVGVMFILALMSSTYSTAGSALTALTTSAIYDFSRQAKESATPSKRLRYTIHTALAIGVWVGVMLLSRVGNQSLINVVYQVVSYLYGPILGLFLFGSLSELKIREKWLFTVIIFAPIASFMLKSVAIDWGYNIGYELIIYNALITIAGLLIISKPKC